MMRKDPSLWVHRFAIFLACWTVLTLTAGALVTSNGAGLSVPDWPLAYGRLVPPQLVGGIRYEYGHRVIAGITATLTLLLAFWLWMREPRRWVRSWGFAALGLVAAQALLGGLTVLLRQPPWASTAHATVGQLFFVTLICVAVFTSAWWREEADPGEDPSSPSVRALALSTTACVVLQLVLGAAFRHNGFGIIPHIAGAGVVVVVGTWTTRAMRLRFSGVRALRRCGILFQAALGTQILLGGAAYWAVLAARQAIQPSPAYVLVSVAHVIVGAMVLASSVVMTLVAFRLVRPRQVSQPAPSTEKAVAS